MLEEEDIFEQRIKGEKTISQKKIKSTTDKEKYPTSQINFRPKKINRYENKLKKWSKLKNSKKLSSDKKLLLRTHEY